MNAGAPPIEKVSLPTMWPEAPAAKSGDFATSGFLVRRSITSPALVLLTSCFETQYCNTPAALPGLMDCTFGRAHRVDGSDVRACAWQSAQPIASAPIMGLIMVSDPSGDVRRTA